MTPESKTLSGQRVISWLLVLGIAVVLWRAYCSVEIPHWNAPRLAAAAALARGLPIYGLPDSGPYLGWIYGPIFPACYALVAVSDDACAILAWAWVLNLLTVAGPTLAVLWVAGGRGARLWAGLALQLGLLLALEPTQAQFIFLHVDALCVCWGVLCAVCLILAERAMQPENSRWLIIAGVAAALAIGTKQVAVAVPIGVALYAGFGRRWRLLARFGFWTVVWSAVLWSAAGWFGGMDRLVFNLLIYHLDNPARTDLADFFGHAMAVLIKTGWPWLAVTAAIWLCSGMKRSGIAGVEPGIEPLLRWIALAHLPFGLFAASKVAGELNSLHTLNYFALWLTLHWMRLETKQSPRGKHVAMAAMLMVVVGAWGQAERLGLPWHSVDTQSEQLALARSHPGYVYLPWNPLVTIITERKILPFDDALLCLERIGRPAAGDVVRAAIPQGAIIAYPEPVQSRFALRYLEKTSDTGSGP